MSDITILRNDLTAGHSLYIERARSQNRLFVSQPYELYSAANQDVWGELHRCSRANWLKHATPEFFQGIERLGIGPEGVPDLRNVNERLSGLTGFQVVPVSGLVPSFAFFGCLSRRHFPATVTVRSLEEIDFSPEPDAFHDVAGHVPMHASSAFADALQKLGHCAYLALDRVSALNSGTGKLSRLRNIIRGLSRFFWFTVEAGLMNSSEGLKAYGATLLSSNGEIQNALEGENVHRHAFRMEWVINQSFDEKYYQPVLFYIESFEHLFELVTDLESWIKRGRLDVVAPGLPEIGDPEALEFLEMARKAA